ncbi:AMP-binding protein [Gordonia sp. VNK21]|uniref:AMP-binding protein n=1 Tax=Gordonia sp. VNK21 TaxID=3382483 RepID=UPI0038D3E7A6
MPFTSPYQMVDIPDVGVYEYLFGSLCDEDLSRPAFLAADGASISYRVLIDRIDAVAGALAAEGIGVGDIVGLYAPNSPEFAVAFHGILRSGATATTVNALYTPEEAGKQLAASGACALFTHSAALPGLERILDDLGIGGTRVIVLDGNGTDSLAAVTAAGHRAPVVDFDPATHIAVLPYSSGTTGDPKGVRLSHANLVANVAQTAPVIDIVRDDRVLAVLPFFHIYGLTVLLNLALYRRATLVTMPRFDLAVFLDTIAETRCTYVFIAPPVAVALAKHPLVDSYDLSSVSAIMSGAAPLDAQLAEAVADRLDCAVGQGFGMSEMSPVSHCIARADPDAPRSSVGKTLPGIECRIVDPATGREVALPAAGSADESAPGELWCKGPNIMLGYLDNAAATADTLDADGYLHTGDIATVDGRGYVRIVDRLKELIKYKGYQVPPAELEAILLSHPEIADAAVVGARGADGEEVPKAFVVCQPGVELTEESVMDFVAGKVAPYKKVRLVEFADAIPKSASGKILRRELMAGD